MGIIGPSSHNGRFRCVARSLKVKTRDKVILSRVLLGPDRQIFNMKGMSKMKGL